MDITMIYGNESVANVLNIAFDNTIPALLVGPTGSGKNTILRYIAGQHKRTDIIRLSLTGETTVDDLIGHYTIKEHNTVWQDGGVTHAVRNGHILVLDELVQVIEQLRQVALDKESLEREATSNVKDTLTEARKKIKEAAQKVAQDAEALASKEKALYQEGYQAAQQEIYKKLGLQLPTEAKE